MKVVMLMFDTLNRNALQPYGGEAITPNFQRLAGESTQFNKFYVGSMPCMPARRELHTGRYNFLHRSWGPLEPFDFSVPQKLHDSGIHTHLVTDHKHYWRDGGATYHTRYSTFEFIRGQEGDRWKGCVKKPDVEWDEPGNEMLRRHRTRRLAQDVVNRQWMLTQEEHFTHKTIHAGLEFLEINQAEDNWFLQIECFDPHEPFFVPEKYLQMYGCKADDFNGWVPYYCDTVNDAQKNYARKFYQALVTMCDDYLGQVMDKMKALNIWEDTLFIVCTDHGFLLGEHQWWGKNIMPVYNEIANTPFFIRYPQHPESWGIKSDALAQTIDIPATLLDYFEIQPPETMLGRSLRTAVQQQATPHSDSSVRDYALYGYFGGHLNITDGRHVYMRGPRENNKKNLYEYTLMPTRLDNPFSCEDLSKAELHPGFDFTKNARLLKIPASFEYLNPFRFGDKLFDVSNDPGQHHNIENAQQAQHYAHAMKDLLQQNDAPEELYLRFNLHDPDKCDRETSLAEPQRFTMLNSIDLKCRHQGVYEALLLIERALDEQQGSLPVLLQAFPSGSELDEDDIMNMIQQHFDSQQQYLLSYQARLLLRID